MFQQKKKMIFGKNGKKTKEIQKELDLYRKNNGLYITEDYISEYILLHASIDLLTNPLIYNRKILSEYRGRFEGIEEYINCVKSFVRTHLINAIPNKRYNFVMSENDFKTVKKTFFDKCEIKMQLSVGNYNVYPPIGSSNVEWLKSSNPKTDKNEEESVVEMNVQGSAIDVNELVYSIASTVAHELTHAYEDINRHSFRFQ